MDKRALRHYWLRQDFDEAMSLIPGNVIPSTIAADISISLTYPKSVKGAVAELNLRGLMCNEADMESMVKAGIVTPRHDESPACDERGNANFVPSTMITYWTEADVDTAAEWLYKHERWTPGTCFCVRSNLRYGQAVLAHRYMCARYNKGFSAGFAVIGLLTLIEPADDSVDYARVRFYPKGTPFEVKK